MLTFKQFLVEMPVVLNANPKKLPHAPHEDKYAEKLGTIRGTKTKYELHKRVYGDDGYTKFFAVHPQTREVHMDVSGYINNNVFRVNTLSSTEKREPDMAKHFYKAILKHHDMVSDNMHSSASQKLYTKKLPAVGVKFHKPKMTTTGGVVPGDHIPPEEIPNHYGGPSSFYMRRG